MESLFTETLNDFLETNEETLEWQGIIQLFNNFPKFRVQTDNQDVEFNMYDMFKKEFAYREIGSEDEQYFYYQVERQLNKSLIEFNPKIKVYLEKWDVLMARKEKLSQLENSQYSNSSNGENKSYINPINSENARLSDKENVDTNDNGNEIKTKEYDVIYSLVGKSNIDLLKDLLQLKNIYLSCLESFSNLFMLVY